MRNLSKISILFLLLFGLNMSLLAAKNTHKNHYSILDNISIDIEDGTIILASHKVKGESVEITRSYQLYINGEEIELSRSQRRLVAKYYTQFFDIIDYAKEIGYEGAKVGVVGAKVGVKAAAKAIKAIFNEYELEELEEELDEESERLELLVHELEEKAEELEEMSDDFEELHYELRSEIDELYDLRWF